MPGNGAMLSFVSSEVADHFYFGINPLEREGVSEQGVISSPGKSD